jgi:hypothetical protein
MKTSFLSAAVLFVGLLGAQYSTAQTTSDMIQETVKSEMQTIQEYVKLDVRQRTLVERHIMAREKDYSYAVYGKNLEKPDVEKAKNKIDSSFVNSMKNTLSGQQIFDLKPYFAAKQLKL